MATARTQKKRLKTSNGPPCHLTNTLACHYISTGTQIVIGREKSNASAKRQRTGWTRFVYVHLSYCVQCVLGCPGDACASGSVHYTCEHSKATQSICYFCLGLHMGAHDLLQFVSFCEVCWTGLSAFISETSRFTVPLPESPKR